MPKRVSVRRFETDEVQGEGSYVVLTSLKVKEVRWLRQQSKDKDFDAFEGGLKLLVQHILKWNWVDDHGEALPLPSVDPSVVDNLTNDEADYLSELLIDAESKN